MNLKSLCKIFSTVGAVFLSHTGFAQAELPAGASLHPLSREDNQRSQFAGSKMKRLQSFDKPLQSPSELGAPSAVQPMPTMSENNRQSYGAATSNVSEPSVWAQSQKNALPSRVYKNIPMQAVYLNGENIVGLRNQVLEGVNVRFDAQGNIYIDAKHYEVIFDSSYHPLLPEELPQLQKGLGSLPSSDAGSDTQSGGTSGTINR